MSPAPVDSLAPEPEAPIAPEVAAVIARAMRDMEHLPTGERLTLLRGVAAICPEGSHQRDVATHLAHLIERCEAEQMEFHRLFSK